jgi:hypothetical protein
MRRWSLDELYFEFGQRSGDAGSGTGQPQGAKPLDQLADRPPTGLSASEASHDRLLQVDAKGLVLNEFFQGLLAGEFRLYGVKHSPSCDNYPEKFAKLKRCNILFLG